jgi:hypothetical protein
LVAAPLDELPPSPVFFFVVPALFLRSFGSSEPDEDEFDGPHGDAAALARRWCCCGDCGFEEAELLTMIVPKEDVTSAAASDRASTSMLAPRFEHESSTPSRPLLFFVLDVFAALLRFQ